MKINYVKYLSQIMSADCTIQNFKYLGSSILKIQAIKNMTVDNKQTKYSVSVYFSQEKEVVTSCFIDIEWELRSKFEIAAFMQNDITIPNLTNKCRSDINLGQRIYLVGPLSQLSSQISLEENVELCIQFLNM